MHRHGYFLGGEEAAIAHHGAGHVQEDDGGAAGDAFVEVELEVFFVEFDVCPWSVVRCPWWEAVARQCIAKRLMEIKFRDWITVLIRFSAFDAFAALAGGNLFVAFAGSLAEVGEDFHQRLALHLVDGAGREADLALAVLVEHAFLEELFE